MADIQTYRCSFTISALCVVTFCCVTCGTMQDSLGQTTNGNWDFPVGTVVVQDLRDSTLAEFLSHSVIDIQAHEAAKLLPDGCVQPFRSQKSDSAMGVLWYRKPGTGNGFAKVRFQQVLDEDESRLLVHRRKQSLGASAKLTMSPDLFRLTYGGRSVYPAPPGVEPGELAAVATIYREPDPSGYKADIDVIDLNGDLQVEASWLATELYRYKDGVLFDAAFEKFGGLTLPALKSLNGTEKNDAEIIGRAHLDRIPLHTRKQGFSAYESVLGTQMQRTAGERKEDAELRRSVLKAYVAVLRGVFLDLRHVQASIKLPREDDLSYQSCVDFELQGDSRLSRQVSQMASGRSQFSAVLNDKAAMTVHVCLRLPDEASQILTALSKWVHKQQALKANLLDSQSASVFCNLLDDAAKQHSLEAFAKVGWTDESEGVIYAGLNVPQHSQLLKTLSALALSTNFWSGQKPEVSLDRFGEYEVLNVKLPPDLTAAIRTRLPINLTHMFVIQEGTRLWMAAGSQSAVKKIHGCIDTCQEGHATARTPLLSFAFDAEQWHSYPADDIVGIGGLLAKLDRWTYELPVAPSGVVFSRRSRSLPDMESVMLFGGSLKCDLSLTATTEKMQWRLNVGEALANYGFARFLDYQLRWVPDVFAE